MSKSVFSQNDYFGHYRKKYLQVVGDVLDFVLDILLNDDYDNVPDSIFKQFMLLVNYISHKTGMWILIEPDYGNIPVFFSLAEAVA